jgi:uncharacterized protein involved in outer membrane biogenesis
MNSVLLWIGGLLVAALALLFAVPYAIDWNDFRGVFEEEASRVLGREVRVGGSVNLRLLPMPYVRFEKVRISDAGGTLGEPFFRTEAFTLWLAVPPLFRGAIEANEVELDRPVLRLVFDERGQGNWQTFRISQGALPFVPSNVAFKSVRIRHGTVSLKISGALETSSLTEVDGEFSATALEGPYKFRGDALWNGQAREIRVATSAFEPDGTLRFKLTARVAGNGNSYTLDGTLAELARGARIDGALTAQLMLDGATGSVSTNSAGEAAAFELRCALTADSRGAKLTDLVLSFERDGRPQIVNGGVQVSWQKGLDLVARLHSRWLDLDRIASRSSDVSPLQSARLLAQRFAELVPAGGSTRATLDVEQVNLGSDTVSELKAGLERTAGVLELREFKAALPGGARLDLRGTIVGEDAREFVGDLMLRGASLGRFLTWAAPGAPREASTGEGAFWLASRLSLSPARVEMTAASAEIGGAQVQGELSYRWDGTKELALVLEGQSIDISTLAPGLLSAAQLHSLVWPEQGQQSRPGVMKLRIRAEEVVDGTLKLNDVDADISMSGGALKMPVLRFTSPDGLRIDMQGDIKDVAGKPAGALRGFVSAPTAEAVAALGGLIGSASALPSGLFASGVSAFELAFIGSFGDRGGPKFTLKSDGMLQGTRASATIVLEGGLAGWREAPIDATVRLDGPDVITLLAGKEAAPRGGSSPTPAALVLKATGPSAASLVTFGQLEAGSNKATFTGRSALGSGGAIDVAGELGLAIADLADLQQLIGPRRRLRVSGIGIDGILEVVAKGKTVQLEPHGLSVGKSLVSGLLTLTAGDQSLRVDGRLRASEASVARLLGVLLDGKAEAGTETRPEVSSPWPDQPFAFGNLDGIDGQLALKVGSLQVADRMALSDAELTVEFAPARVKVTKLDGQALGGHFTSTLSLERAAAGASLSFAGRLADFRIEELVPSRGSEQRSTGKATVSLELNGRALSPRGLIAVMTGKGMAEIADGRISGIAAGAVDRAADAVLAAPTEGAATLEREVRTALEGGTLSVGTRKLSLEVADGAVRVGAVTIEAPDGRVRNETTIDLQELKVDSEWQITSKRVAARGKATAGGPAFPGITLVYLGPLSSIATLTPRLSLDSLDRELTVRRMEREVEQLERLRRQDQERIRSQDGTQPPGTVPSVLEAPLPIAPNVAPEPGSPGAPASPARRRQSVLPQATPIFPEANGFNQSR